MTKRKPLSWRGDEDGHVGYPDCVECFEHMNQPGMLEAAASVGIEHGKSTGQMIREAVDYFHARGHPDRKSAGAESKES